MSKWEQGQEEFCCKREEKEILKWDHACLSLYHAIAALLCYVSVYKNVLCKKLCDFKKNLNTTTKGKIVFIIGSRQGGRILRWGGGQKIIFWGREFDN